MDPVPKPGVPEKPDPNFEKPLRRSRLPTYVKPVILPQWSTLPRKAAELFPRKLSVPTPIVGVEPTESPDQAIKPKVSRKSTLSDVMKARASILHPAPEHLLPRSCKYMKDTIFEEDAEAVEEIDTTPVPVNLPPEAVRRRSRSSQRECSVVSRSQTKAKFRKGQASNRMSKLLKIVEQARSRAASCKMRQELPWVNRDFEDPFMRLQRKMCHENKHHFETGKQKQLCGKASTLEMVKQATCEPLDEPSHLQAFSRLQGLFLGLWHKRLVLDVEFRTKDGVVAIHLPLLSAHSDIWIDYCSQKGCHLFKPYPMVIDFKDTLSCAGLRHVINYLYVGKIKVSYKTCVEIFDAARALKLAFLAQMVEAFTNILLQEHNIWSLVALTRKYPCGLHDIAWTKLATLFIQLTNQPEFLEVDYEDLMWILRQNELKTESEYQVFKAAIRWMNHDRVARLTYFKPLMNCIRFALMTTDELVLCMKADLVFQEPIGMEMLSYANLAKMFASQNQPLSDYQLPKSRDHTAPDRRYTVLGCEVVL